MSGASCCELELRRTPRLSKACPRTAQKRRRSPVRTELRKSPEALCQKQTRLCRIQTIRQRKPFPGRDGFQRLLRWSEQGRAVRRQRRTQRETFPGWYELTSVRKAAVKTHRTKTLATNHEKNVNNFSSRLLPHVALSDANGCM